MIDIPSLLEEKAKEHQNKLLQQIMIRLATNERYMPDEEYKNFMRNITPKEQKEERFDREKFEKLRHITNMGANRFR
ncbi:hypothetical protein [Bacillus mesophilum]|uniref:Uncharacterized protein n=1 Tax=Bacillus mesophilum TaxID=1071718 RepID=A0A7V7V0C0_9BACI|nr:hypothetical protein [Bacillus mesophilum]KAB2335087.1 hypothetical protein F7732_00495 [Bacillus mesophilum]